MIILDDIKARLNSFGYTATEDDGWAISFITQKVENEIKANTNLPDVPLSLYQVFIDKVVGEFLQAKRGTGQLEGWLDIDSAVKQLKEGDTTVTFATSDGTYDSRLNAFIKHLLTYGDGKMAAYRRLRW